MKYLLFFTLIVGCSPGTSHFVHVTPDGQRMPMVVECNPTVKNCQKLIVDSCQGTDYVVQSKERIGFQTYRMEVLCRE
jgi:hypothetical protein